MANSSPSFFFLLSLSLCFHASFATTSKTDESALVAIKSHLITTNPHINALAKNWSETASVCSWIGVTCGSRHNRVTAFNISNLGVWATVPSQLGNLSFLDLLDLSSNHFHGNMPNELSRLHRLRFINLSQNSLSGVIPPAFFTNISKLQYFILSSNLMEGSISPEIGNLTNLVGFAAMDNRFGGPLPTWIGNLKMLRGLLLDNNSFQGPIPQEMSNLYKLRTLGLSSNSLSGSIPIGIFNIATLYQIYMAHNKLSGTLPPTMGYSLPHLEILHLSSNTLSGQIPHFIANASMLSQISLEYNKFTGPIPTSLGNLRRLTCLHLFANKLTNPAPELTFITSLTNCPYLQDLSVSFNPLAASLPPSIGNLSSSLTRIHASGCQLNGQIPHQIRNLSELIKLNLQDNHLSGFLPHFHPSQKLQGLDLSNNHIRGPLPATLCDLPGLHTLILTGNQISGPIPDCVGTVSSLRIIHLASNRLTSKIPLTLWDLKDVLYLDMSNNLFTGNLPQQFGNLKEAIFIDLSRNGLTGAIPNVSMISLISLSLASNKLQGSMPESLADMISLESLDLSDNELSGEIPKALQGLKSLQYFNVSFNRLRGEIPCEGPFKNFNSQFYESNEALCGDPRLHVPRCTSASGGRGRRRILIVVVSVLAGLVILVMILMFLWFRRKKKCVDHSSRESGILAERFSYKQIRAATDGFSQDNLLGTGSFGSVYRASFEKGVVAAVKVFNLELECAGKSFETECEMLRNLRHRNLAKVISACSNPDFKALIMEYMHGGSLEKWLYSDGYFLDIMQRLNVMIDVASALEYLHDGYPNPVIHCDLKPGNILLDRDMVGRVADFGITKLLRDDESIVHTQTLATLGYMAPEYGREGLVSSACDVYSYGIVLMETFTGRRPSDDMFGGETSLRSWISASLPDNVDGVVDCELMRDQESHFDGKMGCVSSIIRLALDCTLEFPKQRMKMKDVLTALNKIKLCLNAPILG